MLTTLPTFLITSLMSVREVRTLITWWLKFTKRCHSIMTPFLGIHSNHYILVISGIYSEGLHPKLNRKQFQKQLFS